MYRILADPAQQANVIDTAWSAFARVDLVQTNDPRQMFVFTDAGAGSYMLRFDGNLQQVGWLREQVEYLPFLGGPVERTLVLGAGAGKDVLQALLSGSSDITAVEINPAMIALTRRHAGYNGGILDHPGVQTVQADGRNFVERASSRFDLIYLNLVYAQATTPGSAALNESYIFTEEAFRAYWSRLAPSGRLAIVSHQALEGSRALISAIGALESEGLQPSEVLSRSALVMLPNPDPNQRISIFILRKTPWTEEEVAAFVEEALARGMQALYVPGVFEIAMRGLTNDEVSLAEFLADSEYNLEPTSDDQPFFFHLDPGLPVALRSLAIAVLVAALAYLAFALPGRRSLRPWQVAYFGLLGLGFMLVEVPLIQRAILLLGNPTLALVVVIASLLLSAGLGSLASGRWPEEILFNRVSQAALVIAALTVALLFLQPPLFTRILPAGLVWRALIAGLLLVPLGFTMGVPFASGLRLVGRDQPAAVALLWGWNAVASVLGSVLAALLAIQAGFSWALGLGAACYLVLAILTTMKKT